MMPADPTEGKALYVPEGVKVEAYEPRKRRRACACGGRGEWKWNGEVTCSKCFLDVKMAEQRGKVEHFIRMALLTGGNEPGLDEAVDRSVDPPVLTAKGYWKLVNVIVLTHRFRRMGRMRRGS